MGNTSNATMTSMSSAVATLSDRETRARTQMMTFETTQMRVGNDLIKEGCLMFTMSIFPLFVKLTLREFINVMTSVAWGTV